MMVCIAEMRLEDNESYQGGNEGGLRGARRVVGIVRMMKDAVSQLLFLTFL
jgi:hypothetical protein